jgi:ABC-type sugar transport system permease subunit
MASITRTPTMSSGGDVGLIESLRQGVRSSGLPWLFIAPSLIVMLFITFYPQFQQIRMSFLEFTNVHLTGQVEAPFIGLENYRRVLTDNLNIANYSFFPLLGFNIVWTLVNVFLHVAIGLAVALALNAQHVIGRRVYRALFVLPWALPGYITALVWNNMWQQNGGGVNLLLRSFNERLGTNFTTNINWLGDTNPPIDLRPVIPAAIVIICGLLVVWLLVRFFRRGMTDAKTGQISISRIIWTFLGVILFGAAALGTLLDITSGGGAGSNAVVQLFDRAGAPTLAFYAVLMANVWLGWPFMMVVATGALQSIPPDLYEAADVDGASKWEQFMQITLPLLRPAMVPAIMLGTIWTFNQFNVIFFITGGGPRGQTNLLITQAYIMIQQDQLYGAAAAFSIIVFFILLIITLIQNRITRATKSFDEA